MTLRAHFKTSKNLEMEGVTLVYGDTEIVCRRAGASNKKFQAEIAKALKPIQAAINANLVESAEVLRLSIPVFVREVIVSWSTRVATDGGSMELVPGIENEAGDGVIPATEDNMVKFLTDIPEFFDRLYADAKERQFFLESREVAAGN